MMSLFFILSALFLAWFFVPYGWRLIHERILSRRCRSARAIILSYDDGPGENTTPQLLDLFAEHRIKATFFPLGRRIQARPSIVRRMISEGHLVGSHTFEHTNAWKSWPWKAESDRDRGIAQVNELLGKGRMFRPPFGKLTLAGLIAVWRHDLCLSWWTVDSRDSWQRRPVDDVLRDVDAAGGGVVLMHDADAYGKSGSGHSEYVLELTRGLIAHAHANGYTLMTLGEILQPTRIIHD